MAIAKRSSNWPFVALSLIALCCGGFAAAEAADASPPPAAQKWIELPLTDGTFHHFANRYVTHTIDIPLPADGGDLEYKIAMKQGHSVTYTWHVTGVGKPDEFYSEFHGHTERTPTDPGKLMFYRKDTGLSESGTLLAPFDGIHGWYLRNDSLKPAVVHLTVSGFYEVIPNQLAK